MVRIDEIDTAEKGWPYRALTIAPGLRSGMRSQKIMHGRSKFRPPPYAARAKVDRTVNDDDLKVWSGNLKSVYAFLGHVGSILVRGFTESLDAAE